MSLHENLLGGPPPTLLPDDTDARQELEGGADPYDVARRHPQSSLAWAVLSDAAWNEGRVVESYAFARVGYHRGLDALRRNGGFLRCLIALQRAAAAIGEDDESERCAAFIVDCDPSLRD